MNSNREFFALGAIIGFVLGLKNKNHALEREKDRLEWENQHLVERLASYEANYGDFDSQNDITDILAADEDSGSLTFPPRATYPSDPARSIDMSGTVLGHVDIGTIDVDEFSVTELGDSGHTDRPPGDIDIEAPPPSPDSK